VNGSGISWAVCKSTPRPRQITMTESQQSIFTGSALRLLLFVIIMEALSREFIVTLPWELLYVDNLVVIAQTEDDLIKRLNEWKDNVENRGVRVNMNKTKVTI